MTYAHWIKFRCFFFPYWFSLIRFSFTDMVMPAYSLFIYDDYFDSSYKHCFHAIIYILVCQIYFPKYSSTKWALNLSPIFTHCQTLLAWALGYFMLSLTLSATLSDAQSSACFKGKDSFPGWNLCFPMHLTEHMIFHTVIFSFRIGYSKKTLNVWLNK